MDYCFACRRTLNGALVCPGCGDYAPDIAPPRHRHASQVPPPSAAGNPRRLYRDDEPGLPGPLPDLHGSGAAAAFGDTAAGASELPLAVPAGEPRPLELSGPVLTGGRAARRRQMARWKKNRRRAAAATAVALFGGGLTVAATSDSASRGGSPTAAAAPEPKTPTGSSPAATTPAAQASPDVRASQPRHRAPAVSAAHQHAGPAQAPANTAPQAQVGYRPAPATTQAPPSYQPPASGTGSTQAPRAATPSAPPSGGSSTATPPPPAAGTGTGGAQTTPPPPSSPTPPPPPSSPPPATSDPTSPAHLCLLILCLN